jgi:hypothetical protein
VGSLITAGLLDLTAIPAAHHPPTKFERAMDEAGSAR